MTMSSKNVNHGEKTAGIGPNGAKNVGSEGNEEKPLGRRARKALAVRQALFTAGLNAFERQPVALVSVLDITEAADVAKGVFYLYFRSKDQYLLALWEEVQGDFLVAATAAAANGRSQSARIESLVQQYITTAETAPAAARFWIRMSSYFSDEVGEPGHLERLQRSFGRRLSAILNRRAVDDITDDECRAALLVDGFCRSAVSHLTGDGPWTISRDTLSPVIAAILKAVP